MRGYKTIADLAYEILRNEGTPLHHKELTKLIMKKRDIEGNTPWNSVNKCMTTDSRFKRTEKSGSGIYGLSEWK